MSPGVEETARRIVEVLSRTRLDLSSEKQTQEGAYEALSDAFPGLSVEREVRIGPGDILDLWVGGEVAVEVKLRGNGKMNIFRQLQRYARHDQVQAIVLATNQSMGLPKEIEGKPAYFVSLGRAWM